MKTTAYSYKSYGKMQKGFYEGCFQG